MSFEKSLTLNTAGRENKIDCEQIISQLSDVDFLSSPEPSNFKEWVKDAAMIDQLTKFVPVVQLYVNNYYRAKAFLNLPIIEHIPPFKVCLFLFKQKIII